MLLPNGKVLKTTAGVINTTYTGYGGNITYYVPKDTIILDITGSFISGGVVYNGKNGFGANGIIGLTSIIALNAENTVNLELSTNVSIFIAPKIHTTIANNAALTAKSIGDILYAAYLDNRENVVYDFSGGTNALHYGIGSVDEYITNLGIAVTLDELISDLSSKGGVITLRES